LRGVLVFKGGLMKDHSLYRPRLSIEITEEQQRALQSRLNHGEGKAVFSVLVDEVISLIDDYGDIIIPLIAGRKAKPRDIFPSIKQATTVADKVGAQS